jgi:hypothetical protein
MVLAKLPLLPPGSKTKLVPYLRRHRNRKHANLSIVPVSGHRDLPGYKRFDNKACGSGAGDDLGHAFDLAECLKNCNAKGNCISFGIYRKDDKWLWKMQSLPCFGTNITSVDYESYYFRIYHNKQDKNAMGEFMTVVKCSRPDHCVYARVESKYVYLQLCKVDVYC